MSGAERILVCDDDQALLELTRELLESEGYEVRATGSGEEALQLLEAGSFDLLLADLVMPSLSGLELLREARKRSPETDVIIITGHGDIDSAVEAIKQGASDYFTKPFHIAKFVFDIRRALDRKRTSEELESLRKVAEGRNRLGDILGSSPPMQALFRQIEQVAPTQSTVMILGESGTGKELTAREIHRHSLRRDKRFVAVSCGTLPAALLESELFGHTKGAFTGANAPKEGLFEAADGGTIFLDEIGATTPHAQVRLLRVLQEREVRRIGSTESRKVNVRVVAATNLDLERAMDEGAFRSDLYYRLTSVVFRLPPLRERVEDIPALIAHFIEKHSRRMSRPARGVSPRALEALCTYTWPGNIRELEAVIERAVIFSSRELIRPGDLPEEIVRGRAGGNGSGLRSLAEVERSHILQVLRQTNGNKLKAAKILRIPRASLYRRMEKYGIGQTGSQPETDKTNFDNT